MPNAAAKRDLARRVAARRASSGATAVGTIEMKVTGADRFKRLSRQLRKAARGDMQRKLVKAIRAEGQPALAATREAWLNVKVTSLSPHDKGGHARPDKDTGLRRRVARATTISATQRGIAIRVSGRRVDPNYPSLPFYLNGMPQRRDWRHPVFGHRTVWVAQRGEQVIPKVPLSFRPAWRRGLERAMDDTVREIESGV